MSAQAEVRLAPPARLAAWLARHRRWFVLTGAGCSTASGIPDYRDSAGAWKRAMPMTFQAFRSDAAARARYWARSLHGWPVFAAAAPNDAHYALARLQAQGRIVRLVTQNVDGLHQAAGTKAVIDLHGRLDRVVCLHCGWRAPRAQWQQVLLAANPHWCARPLAVAPDGDADLAQADFSAFRVPPCPRCGGIVKPDVVFFGDTVPPARVQAALQALAAAEAMLVVGSSLMVYSGFRFARAAAEMGKPIVAINLGRTRADALLADKIEAPCGQVLAAVALTAPPARDHAARI
ncbi:MAG: NAD-dependent protein deacetylase [Burkholderiaceae bacterium]|nr:NAD-dependent protein deacetylase [Burkholderiaceae bacterium]